MFCYITAIFLFVSISNSYSQYITSGQCEDRVNVRPVVNFSAERYAGNAALWYPLLGYSTTLDCQQVNFTMVNETAADMIYIQKNLTTGVWFSREGTVIWRRGTNNQGVLDLYYPNNPSNPLVFRILGIDYTGYTIDYRCVNQNSNTRAEYLYVMSRTRTFTSSQEATIRTILNDNGLDGPLIRVQQDPTICSR